MGTHVLDVKRATDHRFQPVEGGIAPGDIELGVAQVADARREAEVSLQVTISCASNAN